MRIRAADVDKLPGERLINGPMSCLLAHKSCETQIYRLPHNRSFIIILSLLNKDKGLGKTKEDLRVNFSSGSVDGRTRHLDRMNKMPP